MSTWTRWSRFEELKVEYDSGREPSVTDESWEDTWRFALGLSCDVSEAVQLRIGTAFDESPVPDDEHRTPRIPDADRTWLALGAGIQPGENLSVDLGYVHLFFKDSRISREVPEDADVATASMGELVGTYEGYADIFSVAATYRF